MKLGKRNKEKITIPLSKAGAALKDLLIAAATHPTTAALAIMTITTAIRPVTEMSDKGKEFGRQHLDGLFASARDLGAAAAVAPVAIGALGVIKEAIARKPVPKT